MSSTYSISKSLPSYKTLAIVWALVFGSVTAAIVWRDLHPAEDASSAAARPAAFQTSQAAASKPVKYVTKPIGEIRPIVDWVLADNPEITEDREYVDDTGRYITDFGALDPPNWRIVHFRITRDDGSDLNVWLGRPLWYFEELGAIEEGAKVWMEMAEFGAVGNTDVVSIAQCPQPPPRPSDRHHLVTGRFVHSSSEFLRLTVEGVDEPIDATANHPFWSEDRQAFIEASDLTIGERFRLADKSTSTLRSRSHSNEVSAAFNLEVDGKHVYHVSSAGIAVHNACEVFYRAMSRREYASMIRNGGLTLKQGGRNRELFVTQSLAYAERMVAKNPKAYEVIVRFNARSGTVQQLLAKGASNNVPGLPRLGGRAWDTVHVKRELGVNNYGLREGSISIFNNAVTMFGIVK